MSLFRHSAHFWSFGASFFWQFWPILVSSGHFGFGPFCVPLDQFWGHSFIFNSPFLRILETKSYRNPGPTIQARPAAQRAA